MAYVKNRVTCAPDCAYLLGDACTCGNTRRNPRPRSTAPLVLDMAQEFPVAHALAGAVYQPPTFGQPGNSIAVDMAALAAAPVLQPAFFRTFVIGGLRYMQAGQLTVCYCISAKRPKLLDWPLVAAGFSIGLAGMVQAIGYGWL